MQSDQIESATAAEQRRKAEAELAARDLIEVMSSPAGRRFVNRLFAVSGVTETTFDINNPNHTAFREGRRAFGTELWRAIDRHCPNLYLRMMREARNQDLTDE